MKRTRANPPKERQSKKPRLLSDDNPRQTLCEYITQATGFSDPIARLIVSFAEKRYRPLSKQHYGYMQGCAWCKDAAGCRECAFCCAFVHLANVSYFSNITKFQKNPYQEDRDRRQRFGFGSSFDRSKDVPITDGLVCADCEYAMFMQQRIPPEEGLFCECRKSNCQKEQAVCYSYDMGSLVPTSERCMHPSFEKRAQLK
jgi:hypothetical protein